MKRILAMTALGLLLAGCVYAGPPGYYGAGYSYGGTYGGFQGPPNGEAAASPD